MQYQAEGPGAAATPATRTFGGLAPETLNAWIADHTAHDGLWIFQHIPKTAGSSLANEIARNRKPYRNINVAGRPTNLDQKTNIANAIEDFLDESDERAFRACSGHLQRANVDRIRERQPQARLCTFVRHPADRLVSDYRYMRTPAHPRWQLVIREVPDFESYLSMEYAHNKMTAFMLGDSAIPPDEVAERAFERFDFIGVQELYGLSFTLLSTLLWQPQVPAIRKRITEATPDNDVALTEDLRARIVEMNQSDLALFEAARTRLQALEGLVQDPPVRPVPPQRA